MNVPLPAVLRSTMALIDLLEVDHELAKDVQTAGSPITSSINACKDFLARYSPAALNEKQVAGVLLLMVLTLDWHQYSLTTFVSAVQDVVIKDFSWEAVIREFDRAGLTVSPEQFLALFHALLPIAQHNPQFDIQLLWGGTWHHPATQLSFVVAFTSLIPSELDAQTIPGLRQSYEPTKPADALDDVEALVDEARKDTMISLDAIVAVFDVMTKVDGQSSDIMAALEETIGTKMGLFLCSATAVPRATWTPNQRSAMSGLLNTYLLKERPDYRYVLPSVWKQDKLWVAEAMMKTHMEEPMRLPVLLDIAHGFGWLGELYPIPGGFGIDLAALAHRRGYLDLEQWAQEMEGSGLQTLTQNMSRLLSLKAQDEMRTSRNEQPGPRTVPLAIKTVFIMLDILEQHPVENLVHLERQCLQAFPRLINYGEGFDGIIDRLGEDSNALSAATDVLMQDMYKRMYNGELECRDIIQDLKEFKNSKDPGKQDLYACMIHGLFDEFVCFKEYPLEPLATTAVLFGGIIHFGLVSDLTLRVGLGMVLEAVRDWPPESSMYKFGLQALLQLQERLAEWPGYCAQLLQIPGLQGTEPYIRASKIYESSGNQLSLGSDTNGINGVADGMSLPNGQFDDMLTIEATQFKSIHAEPSKPSNMYEDPDEETQERVVFFFNNLSEQNLKSKIGQLQEVLQDQHHQWFAYFIVEERAKVEPNYQPLYLDLLGLLGKKMLWEEVLRETYVSVQKILNAELTMKSAAERRNLKNLSNWLGSLTIARDKPIKQKNISFKDLLIEAFDTQRLLVAIPFTCGVLIQATQSVVFKPPNPWVVEIIKLLLELYHHAELKLNQKFEIEVLCKELNINHLTYEVSSEIRNRHHQEENLGISMISDGLNGFDDLPLGSINRTVRNSRFSPSVIASTLPDLESILVFPPSSGSVANQARLRQIVNEAVRRAILEIIAPVVERSVTIATIATSNLIHKDFARESDEDRVRKSAQQMVRQLSGSLALVTCKEPLRMSMTNYIRQAQSALPDQAFPEGAILMCVNDNLDNACRIVEKQAEDRSMPEIESHIEHEISQRRQYMSEHPNEFYMDPNYSRWASCIPDPYKLNAGGLNQEQMAIYLDFARQSRGSASHVQTSSSDSGRQLPDVLQEASAFASSVPTPGDVSVPPQQSAQLQQGGRMLPPPLPSSRSQPQINGYLDPKIVQDRIQDLIIEINRSCKDRSERKLKELGQESPIIDIVNQIWDLLESSSSNNDTPILACAHIICLSLDGDAMNPLAIDVLVHMLHKLCQLSLNTHKEVIVWFANQDDEVFNVPVIISLLEVGLMEMRQVDATLTKFIKDRKEVVFEIMYELTEALLFNNQPIALRADFAGSLGAIGHWLVEEPNSSKAKELMQRFKEWGIGDIIETEPDEQAVIRQHQLKYIFAEWIAICNFSRPSEKVFGAFISQLHQKHILNSQEEMAVFLRLCIESSIDNFDQEDISANGHTNEAYFTTDCLARLIVLLVKNQGNTEGAVKGKKATYMDSILSLIVLVLNNHHETYGERFHQKVFFRLFSSILCDWHDMAREGFPQDQSMMLTFADNFLLLGPHHFPGFSYGWLILISHRVFIPGLLKNSNEEVRLNNPLPSVANVK